MGRRCRIIQIPLTLMQQAGLGDYTNPFLSHWGLLVGDNDILLEIFPKGGIKPFHSFNTLRYTHNPDLRARQAEFKFGIFPQGETDYSDDQIIEKAKEVIDRHPIYNLDSYNCQDFTNDLNSAITGGAGLEILQDVSRFFTPTPFKHLNIFRGAEGEAAPTVPTTEVEAITEIQNETAALEKLPELWGLENSGSYTPENLPTEVPEYDPKDKFFKLTTQKYVAGQDAGNLADIGVVADQAGATAAYELAGIAPPEDYEDLSAEEKAKLAAAELLVDTEA